MSPSHVSATSAPSSKSTPRPRACWAAFAARIVFSPARCSTAGFPYVVDYACILAAARRTFRNAYAAPLPPIRSLQYLVPIVQEVIQRPPGPRDISQLRERLATHRLP